MGQSTGLTHPDQVVDLVTRDSVSTPLVNPAALKSRQRTRNLDSSAWTVDGKYCVVRLCCLLVLLRAVESPLFVI